MFNNHVYNLLVQLVEEHKSLWRIKKHYLKEAKGCQDCQNFWKRLEKEKTALIRVLAKLAREHFK